MVAVHAPTPNGFGKCKWDFNMGRLQKIAKKTDHTLKRYGRNSHFATRHYRSTRNNYSKSGKIWYTFHIFATPDPFSFQFFDFLFYFLLLFYFPQVATFPQLSCHWFGMETGVVNTIGCLSPFCASSFKFGVKVHCGMVYKGSKHHLNGLHPPGGAWIIGELDSRAMILWLMNNLGYFVLIKKEWGGVGLCIW